MPLHHLRPLPDGSLLGLWRLTETPAALWPQLPAAAGYRALLPAAADFQRQAQWLAGRALVHALLNEWPPAGPGASFRLRNDEARRPYFEAPGPPAPAVSLSHSGAWAAAVLAPPGRRAGVDVEVVRDKAQRIAPKFLAPAELAAAHACAAGFAFAETAGAPALFSLLWSAKETLFKLAARRGVVFKEQLLLPLLASELLEVNNGLTGDLAGPARPTTRHRICYLAPAPGYVLTYCTAEAVSSGPTLP